MGDASAPVLELWSLLQELQTRVGEQDASHHRLQVVWGYIPTPLLSQDVKHAPHRVHLDTQHCSFFSAVGFVAQSA